MRRFIPLLLLACLLFLPQATPEVMADPVPTIPPPEYKTYLPWVPQIGPTEDIVGLIGETPWVHSRIKNIGNRNLQILWVSRMNNEKELEIISGSRLPIPYLAPGMEIPSYNSTKTYSTFYATPCRPVIELETSPIRCSGGIEDISYSFVLTNTSTYTLDQIKTNFGMEIWLTKPAPVLLHPGESAMVRARVTGPDVGCIPKPQPMAVGLVVE